MFTINKFLRRLGWVLVAPGGRLSVFYGCLFLIIGVYLPFWPVWLKDRGMGATEIGILLAVGTWVKVLANPIVGHVVDQRGDRRRPMTFLAGLMLAFLILFYFAQGFWTLLAVSALFGFAISALLPLADNLTVRAAEEDGFQYGRVRLWGSISFIVAAMLGGRILEENPISWILMLIVVGSALTWLSTMIVPDIRWPVKSMKRSPSFNLLRNPIFLLFIISASLVQSSHAVYYGFGTLLWKSMGHSDTAIGWLWAEGVLAEILLLFWGGAMLSRLGPTWLLVIAGIAGSIRWIVAGLATDLSLLILCQALHAFTFGATHLSAVHFIQRAAPQDMSASAQSLYSALGSGVGFGIMMPIAGYLYEVYGPNAFIFMAAMAASGTSLALFLIYYWDGERLSVN